LHEPGGKTLTGSEATAAAGRGRDGEQGEDLRKVLALASLFALWLLMSGLFKPLLIGLGLVSVLAVAWLTGRMDRQDGDRLELRLSPLGMGRYLLWLMGEIARANWAVTRIILARDMPLRQHLFRTPFSQKSDLGQVIFANSITLTPGTITVETERGGFLVHALDYSEGDAAALAEMDRRVAAVESGGGG